MVCDGAEKGLTRDASRGSGAAVTSHPDAGVGRAVGPAAEPVDNTRRPSAGVPSTRTTRTVLLPVLLVGCLGVLALPADRATTFAARPASAPAAAAATVLLPAGTEVGRPSTTSVRPGAPS